MPALPTLLFRRSSLSLERLAAWASNGARIPAWQRVATDLKVEDQLPPLLPEDATLADGVMYARIQRAPECGMNASTQILSLWYTLVQAVLTTVLEAIPATQTSQADAVWQKPDNEGRGQGGHADLDRLSVAEYPFTRSLQPVLL